MTIRAAFKQSERRIDHSAVNSGSGGYTGARLAKQIP